MDQLDSSPELPDENKLSKSVSLSIADLHRDYAVSLSAFLRGLLRDPELAREALQNTFLAAVRHAAELRPESVKAWLFQVACNEARQIRRRAKQERRGLEHMETSVPPSTLSAEELAIAMEDAVAVRRALEELPESLRRVVELRADHDRSFAEIASELGIPLGTALTRMRTALEKLRRALRE